MLKNIAIAILIGLIIGGAILWRVMPPKERVVEKLVIEHDTSFQVITKTVIKVVYRDTSNNDTTYISPDEVYVVVDTGGSPAIKIITIHDTINIPPKKFAIVPNIGYLGGGIGAEYDGWGLNYGYYHKKHEIFLQKEF